MKSLATQPLIRVSCMNKGEKIGLVAYADLIVHDKDNTIVALRIGGYPEAVQGMSDIIIAGCDLELQGSRKTIRVTTKGHKHYERKLSHDSEYAEAMHYLNRKLPFHDLPSADNWLTDALLNRQSAADRLLETTRLTDLIYIGCSFEDVCYGTQRADQPVNAETLAADVFAALFSPVLRRKDTDNVNLRQRFFNKPVLDRLLSDDRFDRMKGMCENKELPSYAAATSFAHELNSALENKPYEPKVYYLQIIDTLSTQVDQTLEKSRKPRMGLLRCQLKSRWHSISVYMPNCLKSKI